MEGEVEVGHHGGEGEGEAKPLLRISLKEVFQRDWRLIRSRHQMRSKSGLNLVLDLTKLRIKIKTDLQHCRFVSKYYRVTLLRHQELVAEY